MNRYLQEGHVIERYLTNIEQQNQILMNLLETINRQNLSSRNLINSYVNPFAPRYRDTNFNRNWNNTLSFFPPSLNRTSPVRNRETRAFSNRSPTRNTYQHNINRERRTRLRSQNPRQRNTTRRNTTQTNTTQTNSTQTATNTQPNIFLQTILSMLSPVRISPSPGQIENATETYLYNSNEPRNCPIDRESINRGDSVVRIRHCSHIFRRDSIMTWFQHNPRCPLCRYDIRDYTTNDNNLNPIPPPPPPPSIPPPSMPPPSLTPPSLLLPSLTPPSMPPPGLSPPSIPPPSLSPPSIPPPRLSSASLSSPSLIPPPTHNAETQFINDLSFNNVASILNNFTNVANIDGLTENFFSNLIQNLPLNELNNLASINLDISGNTASLSFEGNVSPPPNDVD